jgi:hypothetical protein
VSHRRDERAGLSGARTGKQEEAPRRFEIETRRDFFIYMVIDVAI